MKGCFKLLVVLIIVAIVAIWYFADHKHNPTAEKARDQIENTARDAKDATEKKLDDMGLTTDNIKKELAASGKVIRTNAQAAGTAIMDAASDTKTTATIKSKFLESKDLSASSISVSTTDGKVTLSGTVSSADDIRKAIGLAMDTENVKEVVSTLQVK